MQLCANKLDKKDFFGKSDPFLVFYRSNEDGTFTICHKTEVIKNTLNPVWQPFTIPVRALCNGDFDRTVKVDVYDWDRDGSHDFIGEFTTSYRELSRGQNQFNVYEVLNPKKKGKKKKYINSGTVTLLSFKVESEYTFVDFIRGGTQLNFTVAIDFTASNVYGKAKGVSGDAENPNCVGIEGVLEAYFQSLRTVQLYGPTNFAPVINKVANGAVEGGESGEHTQSVFRRVSDDMEQQKVKRIPCPRPIEPAVGASSSLDLTSNGSSSRSVSKTVSETSSFYSNNNLQE
ncbi:copine-9-like [Notothenia coriiceps]|uniref:Copine-9-like n=1 Tax=Notothenia coriiceps TaxID=8208 RepID=A0A6I9Q3D4_9TELE|nr:PREDICTED: copine-9-like [Notothenia coriiceps]